MLQLTQKLKDGSMLVQEVPSPQLAPGLLLVRNHYSLISAGTEGSTAKAARQSLLGKMKSRPDQVRQVVDLVRRSGLKAAYRAVTKKLEAYSPCGYSSAGVVIGVGEGITGFAVGDKVACAGAGFANHAEIVTVPVNLCVRLAQEADLSEAAYNTMGAIAMQGVRQADLRLGETVVVIGLGLLGRLTAKLLRASGCKVIGVDVNAGAVKSAAMDVDLALPRDTVGIEDQIDQFCSGQGADAVIITAGTSSLDPINFAGEISRKKGTVVVVGAVPTGFDRNPDYYPKELTLKMSCSYGPGRYDLEYEEEGLDYPYAYVRWTEQRNMSAFQELLATKRIEVGSLTSHTFRLEDSPKAYDMIVNHTEPYLGVLIKYDVEKQLMGNTIAVNEPQRLHDVNVAFVGAGSYAQGNLLPNLPSDIGRIGVMTNSGTTSKRVAERFGFEFCTSDEKEIFDNSKINTVFVATRHDSHASYVLKALKAGKSVFVEKPLSLYQEDADEIMATLQGSKGQLMIGFNRRFAPLTQELMARLPKGPKSMIFRVNAGVIPSTSWIQDMQIGGGRMIGEGCHFIDYMCCISNSLPIRLYASVLPDPEGHQDTVNVVLDFEDGSTGVLGYYANGAKDLPKEYFEVHCAGMSAVINDFRELTCFGKVAKHFKSTQDKGQQKMLEVFFHCLKTGTICIDPKTIAVVTKATFAVAESLRTHQIVSLI